MSRCTDLLQKRRRFGLSVCAVRLSGWKLPFYTLRVRWGGAALLALAADAFCLAAAFVLRMNEFAEVGRDSDQESKQDSGQA